MSLFLKILSGDFKHTPISSMSACGYNNKHFGNGRRRCIKITTLFNVFNIFWRVIPGCFVFINSQHCGNP